MNEIFMEFESILNEENQLLDTLSEKQKVLRDAVTAKDWKNLIDVISEINMISDSFQHFDFRRDEIQKSLSSSQLKPYFERLSLLHSKLLRCKAENQALGSYVNIAKAFVQQVIDKALPQSRNKNYLPNGKMAQSQPQSVVVNQLF